MITDARPVRPTEIATLWDRLRAELRPEPLQWLEERRAEVTTGERPLGEIFPAVARTVGRGELDDGWTADEAARAVLVLAFAGERPADEVVTELTALYRYGDTAEKLAVLRALAVPSLAGIVGDRLTGLLQDAIRTNDQRLLSAALGPYATTHLDGDAFRQAVLKCVFTGVPLDLVHGLPDRADAELARMMTDFAAERTAAGRDVPPDIRRYLAEEN
jgi:hypothetical protein